MAEPAGGGFCEGNTIGKGKERQGKGERETFTASRPVTRSLSRVHNNLVSETAVMGDAESLQARLEAFMEAMTLRQQALETQIGEIATQVKEVSHETRRRDSSRENLQNKGAEQSRAGGSRHWQSGGGGFRAGSEDMTEGTNRGFLIPRYSKLEFPSYDGREDPLVWLRRCEQFFLSQRTPTEDRVGLAAFHLTGEAQLWYYQIEQEDPDINWEGFKFQCNIRFGPPLSNNPLGELSNLKQRGSVEEYQRQFQSLLARTTDLKPNQQVSLFTAGLVESLRIEVELHQPGNLGIAMNLARAFERKQLCLGASRPTGGWTNPRTSSRPVVTPSSSNGKGSNGITRPTPTTTNGLGENTTPFFKRLTRAEIAERRAKGLCFNCDDPYTTGHRCKRLFWIEVPDEESNFEDEVEENPEISLRAISGLRSSRTMQLQAKIADCPVWVLIDSGSTHNFIRSGMIPRLGISVQERPGLRVAVANGEKVSSGGICRGVAFQVGADSFITDFYSIPLDGFDVVLGIKWLSTLGPILWDFASLTMSFNVEGKPIKWKGQFLAPTLRIATLTGPPPLKGNIDSLLDEFPDLFETPTGLPPARECDHRIQLETGSGPVVVRPYRYPHFQKDEIERQCAAMLQQGVIRPSRSPFSSPVLLVKKADGSWRFCVDYRELNSRTIKDKFPIPVVDELLDELHGAKFFTKLDLTSGYHQIRMDPCDIEKTAFRTHHGHFEFLVMPFGLSNAPSTFQSLMNEVFCDHLRRFVLVFFDDILIYSQTWAEHLHHIRVVFELLRLHRLFLKKSKCSFGSDRVAYLGHIIHGSGVEVDQSKIQSVIDWPTPQSTKALRGFLGLAGYYRKFIKDFGQIAAPLTSLLKKNSFHWDEHAEFAFLSLKQALSKSPVLCLPDFTSKFVVECDASGSGIGAVLQQHGHPVAFFSRKLADRYQKLAAYERELIGLAKAVTHWRPYLWGRQFVIKTDHFSLKYLLEQRLTTSPQQHWVSKLLGFDFRVDYRAGSLNRAADALSRRDEESGQLFAVSYARSLLLDDLRHEIQTDETLRQLRDRILKGEEGPDWGVKDDLILYRGRAYLAPSSPIIPAIFSGFHDVSHEGIQKTLERIRRDFYWKGMKATIHELVQGCLVCQRNKWETLHPAGLLQPLPVPTQIWADISMDFVEALPKVLGKSVLLVVVDRLSKYAHFIPLGHPYSAITVAHAFFTEVFRLHGLPESIVSDRDKVFQSLFWKELFRLSGSKLSFSSAYHPQSDGQTEVVNRTIEMYLRCLTGDRPRKWLEWLPWAEYCYNTSFHTSLKTTPFRLVYGRDPPRLLDYTAGSTRVEAVDRALLDRSEFLRTALAHLAHAQSRMKNTYDAAHRDVEFEVGDLVWLKLHPYRQLSVARRNVTKLSPKFYGPFKILSKIGSVAYELDLPTGSRIHNVFHVSLLKALKGPPPETITELPPIHEGRVLPVPHSILRARINRGRWELLVRWSDSSEDSATWEDLHTLKDAYPDFELEDKLNFEEGSNVTDAFVGKTYQRRARVEG